MSQQRRYLISALTNWVAFAATLLVAFFLSPYLIRMLGNSRYGIWVFVESILAYFTLFDLGIAACVVRFVAKFYTSGEHGELNRLVSSCFALFVGLGSIAFVIGAAMTPLLAPMLSKAGLESSEIVGFMILMLGNLAMSLPCSVFPSILDGLERFAPQSIVRILFLSLRTTAMITLVSYQPSLLGLGIILSISNLCEYAVMAVLCRIYLPRLRIGIGHIDRETLKLVKGYSLDAFLAMIGGRVSVQSGAIIIGIFRSAPEITWFAIALRLVEFAKALLRSATTTLTPAISSLEATGDVEAIRKVLFDATRWVLYLIIPVNLGLIVFGRPFLRIWLGSAQYAEECYPPLVILSASLSLVVAQSVASRILYGLGRLRLYARLALAEGAINVGLCLLLVQSYGIVGVACAVAIPNFLNCLIVLGITCRSLNVPIGDYVRSSWCLPLLAALSPLAVWLRGWVAAGWMELGVAVLAGLTPYVLVVAMLEGVLPRARKWLTSKRAIFVKSTPSTLRR